MHIEHIGYMVSDPPAVAEWYIEHLGFRVRRKLDASPHTRFLADASGRVMIEIYNNPRATVPDYATLDPLVLHLAFTVDDVDAARQRLIEAGATPLGQPETIDTGDRLAMLRDPWGFPIQLCRRAEPMV
ncbi:MAG: VOC family protein [Pirellulales bacterium]|nr:VOC family protein [Pirellulales bacterium]